MCKECLRIFCVAYLERHALMTAPGDKLWRVLQEFGIDGHLLLAFKSLYCQPEVCVRVKDKNSKSFYVGVGLCQRDVSSPLFFIIYMNWMNELSQAND